MATLKNISGMTLAFPSGVILAPDATLSVSKPNVEQKEAMSLGLLVEAKGLEPAGDCENGKQPNP